MNSKHQANLLSEQLKLLHLNKGVDDEIASTHPIKTKIGARAQKNVIKKPSASKSMSELGIPSYDESSNKTSSTAFHPNPSTTNISLKLKPSVSSSSKNYTFNTNQMRDIERNNQTLMKKIMNTKVTNDIRRTASSTSGLLGKNALTPSAAINRKKQQRQIDIGNDILQRKLMQISRRRPALVPK